MGRSDEYQFDYLDDAEHFADQINGALFRGRQVVKPGELEEADIQTVFLGKEAGERKNIRAVVDKARIWKGRLIHVLVIENQTYVDYHMVLRNMLSESLSYQRQWKQKRRRHEKEKDLKTGTNEFFSGMARYEKFIPVITLVVYCGTEQPWDGARCLYDLLEVDEELKEFITNYRLNLYDCHEHDSFDEYKTGLRQLFEVVRYGKEKEKLKELLEANKEIYSRIDNDTRQLFEVVGKVQIGKEYETMEDGERRYDMCKAFMDMKLEGKAEGKVEGKVEGKAEGRLEYLVETICKKIMKNKPAAVIADELEEELPTVERVIEIQRQVGSSDVGKICQALWERQPVQY